ncbi:MAG: DUF1016 N-terminal domain-containing protein, partial [Rudanella sp.]|nr:DUF1016 N-terminal domain-containing protein [Rudanella sp.]
RITVEIEQQGQLRADYGIHLIESLSLQLTEAFGKGYSLPNMWKFKQFFLAFPILSTNGRELASFRKHLRSELCWSHYRILMPLENKQEQAFYIQQAADEQWTVKFLHRMITTRYYYKVALGEQELIPNERTGRLTQQYSSTTFSVNGKTERTRIARIKKQLLDRYVGFAFVAQRQFVSVGGQENWAELVFFHYVLNRFILIQLGEHDPVTTTHFRLLLDGYMNRQPPTIDTLPIGCLVDQKGLVKIQTTSHELIIAPEEQAVIPIQL